MLGPHLGAVSGRFDLFLTGPAGKSVVVEASDDLQNWQAVWTNIFDGALNFIDPQSDTYPHRLYRAYLP